MRQHGHKAVCGVTQPRTLTALPCCLLLADDPQCRYVQGVGCPHGWEFCASSGSPPACSAAAWSRVVAQGYIVGVTLQRCARCAGGRASPDALRSITISQQLLGTKEVFIIHHTGESNGCLRGLSAPRTLAHCLQLPNR